MIPVLTILLIIGALFVGRRAKMHPTKTNIFLTFLASMITILFEPVAIILVYGSSSNVDGGAIQIASTLIGLFLVGWSVVRFFKSGANNAPVSSPEI
jgi:hypothetical protein